jgi:hypothetical protein
MGSGVEYIPSSKASRKNLKSNRYQEIHKFSDLILVYYVSYEKRLGQNLETSGAKPI